MRRFWIAAVVGLAVFAFAASAAELHVDGGVLQAGGGEIGSCAAEEDTTVAYGEPSYDGSGTWTVDSITVESSDACDGTHFSVVVTDSDGTALTETQHEVFAFGSVVVTFQQSFDTQAAADVHLVIRSAP